MIRLMEEILKDLPVSPDKFPQGIITGENQCRNNLIFDRFSGKAGYEVRC